MLENANKNKYPPFIKMDMLFFSLYYFRYLLVYFIASSTATAQATVAPTIGLLPIPISPIIST